MSAADLAHYNPRDCYARLHQIQEAMRALELAASKLRFAWDAETLRRHPEYADWLRVPPAKSEAELADAQAAFHAAVLALRAEAALDVVQVNDHGRRRGA